MLSFIFADLIVLPILDIYRKVLRVANGRLPARDLLRHDRRAGLVVEFVFQVLGLTRAEQRQGGMASVHWNYTTVLNIIFLSVAAALVCRYFRKGGGIAMLRMMSTPMPEGHDCARARVNPSE